MYGLEIVLPNEKENRMLLMRKYHIKYKKIYNFRIQYLRDSHRMVNFNGKIDLWPLKIQKQVKKYTKYRLSGTLIFL